MTANPLSGSWLVAETRHDVKVRVHHVLAPDLAHIPPGVVFVWSERGVQVRLCLEEQLLRGGPLLRREIEHRRAVGFRDDNARPFQGARLAGFDAQEAEVVFQNEGVTPKFSLITVGTWKVFTHDGLRIRDGAAE
ncbi:hypothetical protein GCM10008955_26800 [Deinococcus malanensis]|uniref:Uncharacterized protein n=1 Tax=Deinococcus malanensis TaxID=1706855 RepID=A0ABQ2EYA4_9DEIO|nr:hypothetical protein GCM10008955_26800 [Deinococcus malanensis]